MFVFGIFANLAEFERNLIRERTCAGLAVARARGRLGGRPEKPTEDQVKSVMPPFCQATFLRVFCSKVTGGK